MLKKFIVLLLPVLLFAACSSGPDATASKEAAEQARDKALAVKADVAEKSAFDAAQALYDQAASLEKSGDKTAILKYQEAEKAFTAAYEAAKAKRDKAQAELDKARAEIKTVENEAAELERLREQTGANQ